MYWQKDTHMGMDIGWVSWHVKLSIVRPVRFCPDMARKALLRSKPTCGRKHLEKEAMS
jgi:hypothetical protein